jgi:alpha 1,3-glucosidase
MFDLAAFNRCWPGSVSYLDFVLPEVREYWASLFALDQYDGSTPTLYTWNDMNEVSSSPFN